MSGRVRVRTPRHEKLFGNNQFFGPLLPMMISLTEGYELHAHGHDRDRKYLPPFSSCCHGHDRGRDLSGPPHLDTADEIFING